MFTKIEEIIERKLSNIEKLGVFFFLSLFLLVTSLIVFKPNEPVRDVRSTDDAWRMCQEFVKNRLLAPKTAEFPSLSDDKIKRLTENQFVAVSYVDAQNTFGVPLRTDFTCVVTYTGKDRWHLDDLRIKER